MLSSTRSRFVADTLAMSGFRGANQMQCFALVVAHLTLTTKDKRPVPRTDRAPSSDAARSIERSPTKSGMRAQMRPRASLRRTAQ